MKFIVTNAKYKIRVHGHRKKSEKISVIRFVHRGSLLQWREVGGRAIHLDYDMLPICNLFDVDVF